MKQIDQLDIRDVDGGAVIAVKVVPASSRDKVAGVLGAALKITTSAPAEKGKANAAVRKTLAETLGIDGRDVELISGPTNPRKEFRITALTADQVRRRLDG